MADTEVKCIRTSSCKARMHWGDCETNPVHIEVRLEKNAITGLVNIHRAITGKDCPRHLSLGMATSAVSSLKARNAQLEEALRGLMWRFEVDDEDLLSTDNTAPDIVAARTALTEKE